MARSQSQEATAEQQAALKAVDLSFALGAFRQLGVKDSAAAVKAFFGEAAQLRWQRLSAEYSEEQLNDFFLGALVLTDGKSETEAKSDLPKTEFAKKISDKDDLSK